MDTKNVDKFKVDFKQVKNYLGEILTGIIAVALIVYCFVTFGIRSIIDEYFITTFIIGFIIMLVITSVWYPNAKQKAQFFDKGYIKQRTEYGILVDRVTNSLNQKNLTKFCAWATEQNRLNIIKQKLLNHGIDFDLYFKYKNCPSKIEEEQKELTEKQRNILINLIENGVKVKTINSNHILTGLKDSKLLYDTNSSESKYDTLTISSKILISIISSVVMAFLVFSVGGFTIASLANLLMWYILMAWNMFTSYQTGYKSISIHRTNYYKKLRTFLEEFISSEYFDGNKNIKDLIDNTIKQELSKAETV